LAAAALLAAAFWLTSQPDPLPLEPWSEELGLRSLQTGSVSAGQSLALIGLEPNPTQDIAPPADLCDALFPRRRPGRVPVAFFTDHYCPNCRGMVEVLQAKDGIDVMRHELPLLGPDSVVAARAALAAGLQGRREAFHLRMTRSAFAPTEAYLHDLALGIGIEPDRLIEDMSDPQVELALQEDVELASSLGFDVVPVAVVGRTVVLGQIAGDTLDRLFEHEAGRGSPCPLRH
jgi:protein-disulfide isomerase